MIFSYTIGHLWNKYSFLQYIKDKVLILDTIFLIFLTEIFLIINRDKKYVYIKIFFKLFVQFFIIIQEKN